MRCDDGSKQFSRKLFPEVIEKILQRAADAAVVIRRAEHEHIRRLDARLERSEPRLTVCRLNVEQRERLFAQVEQVHLATLLA